MFREPSFDLAILNLDILSIYPNILSKCDPKTIDLGEDLLILGFPLGSNKITVHKGFLSAKGKASDFPPGALKSLDDTCPLLQIDGTINEGFSGGPVIQVSSGKICGFITSKYGLLSSFKELRHTLNSLIDSDFFKELRSVAQKGDPIIIGGIKWHKFVLLLIDSLNIMVRSIQFMHVGIGYAINIEVLEKIPFKQ